MLCLGAVRAIYGHETEKRTGQRAMAIQATRGSRCRASCNLRPPSRCGKVGDEVTPVAERKIRQSVVLMLES